jgi:hypothetical protein
MKHCFDTDLPLVILFLCEDALNLYKRTALRVRHLANPYGKPLRVYVPEIAKTASGLTKIAKNAKEDRVIQYNK